MIDIGQPICYTVKVESSTAVCHILNRLKGRIMKKKSKTTFMRGFVKTFVYLLFYALLFAVGYKGTALYLQHNHKTKETKNGAVNITEEGKTPSVAFNLLFAIDEDAGCLKHMVLEVLNTNTDSLSYITIPLNSSITLSSDMYERAMNQNSEMPQIIRFSELGNFMEVGDFYEFSEAVLEDYLDVDISFFTVMQNDDFNLVFKRNKEENCYVFRDTLKAEIDEFTEEDIITYMKAFYKKTTCNIDLSKRLKYTPSLAGVNIDDVAFVSIPGEKLSGSYQINKNTTEKLFKKLKDGTTLAEIRAVVGSSDAVSLGKNVMILNGSGVNGLAAEYKKKLEDAGYTVTGIDNYDSSDVETTEIQVKEDGLGIDLEQYFKSAEIEQTEDLPENIDIQIILGASETETD